MLKVTSKARRGNCHVFEIKDQFSFEGARSAEKRGTRIRGTRRGLFPRIPYLVCHIATILGKIDFDQLACR
jgi:hypothetical protein